MLHALAILYARWRIPESAKSQLPEMERNLSPNVHNDLNWIESELKASNGAFLVGDSVTAADIMMGFSVQFILARKLGTGDKRWPAVEEWLESIEATKTYKDAVTRTGYSL